MQKVIRQEIIKYNQYQEDFELETRGDLQFMPPAATMVAAIFGCFKRTENGTLLYTASVERERDGSIGHDPHSEYFDDYRALKENRIEVIE